MNRIYADSPDNIFKQTACGGSHPCAHRTIDKNGLVTVTFVHIYKHAGVGCSRCAAVFPLTFWQYQGPAAIDMEPS